MGVVVALAEYKGGGGSSDGPTEGRRDVVVCRGESESEERNTKRL